MANNKSINKLKVNPLTLNSDKTTPHVNEMGANGFTIMELLVVLVILSLATALLVSSLSVIWRSFEKLEQRQLNNAANIGGAWFRRSIEGAIQHHPDIPMFFGDSKRIRLTTVYPIDDSNVGPTKIEWNIRQNTQEAYATELWYTNKRTGLEVLVLNFEQEVWFSYEKTSGQLSLLFNEAHAELPKTVTLNKLSDAQTCVTEWCNTMMVAHPLHAGVAETPPEMAVFGEYEF
ncbi:prepilin-type N-terminal cleavage/methylation domain-containing protein [Agaribacter marinus]|uniref:Prepilin-type N-terminal cleavage/methylation domain-containing protein n=1 Tax=Agaribacter marinus TaxID=1431249 RepID=A0AA37SZL6_9ALTE|nr:prepilin-type N-terminal cleavage/methylation domain-containing protein [Agaribacter marinus]GLR70871.1 hypothetical protein GCM10007852_17790 [Agaribacter marinus]